MAVTYIDHAGTQGQTDFAFTFPYLEDEHIKVEIDGVGTTDFTVVATPTAKIVLDTGLSAAASVRVRRRSAPNVNLVDFVNGSVLTEAELDLSYRHNRYLAEEIAELNDQSLQIESGGTEWDAKTKRIKNVGTAVDSTDAVTKVYLDNKVAQVSTGATQPPLKWVFSAISGTNNTYTVTGAEVLGDTAYEVSIDGLIKEPTVEYTVDPSTDTLTIIPNMTGSEDIVVIQRGFGVAVAGTVGTNSLVDGSVTNPKLAVNSVANSNIQDDAVTPAKLNDTQAYTVTGLISNANINIKRADEGPGLRLTYDAAIDEVRDLFIDSNGDFLFTNVSGTSGIVGTLATLDSNGNLDITGDYKVNGTNLQTVPTGTVSAFAGSAAPTGYALCDGSAVNRTAQASLFGVIGTTYGAGDGSTTFNLPDLKGRVVAGLGGSLIDTSAVVNGAVSNFTQVNLTGNLGGTIVQGMAVSGPGIGSGITVQIVTNQNTIHLSSAVTLSDGVRLTFATTESLGDTGGAKTHTLTESEMPSHNHSAALSGISGTLQFPGVIGGGNKLVSANTSNTGGDEAHNNVQPTIILNYIIKT